MQQRTYGKLSYVMGFMPHRGTLRVLAAVGPRNDAVEVYGVARNQVQQILIKGRRLDIQQSRSHLASVFHGSK